MIGWSEEGLSVFWRKVDIFPLYSDSNKQEKPTQFIYEIFRNPVQWYNTTQYDFIPSNSDVYPVSMDCVENLSLVAPV